MSISPLRYTGNVHAITGSSVVVSGWDTRGGPWLQLFRKPYEIESVQNFDGRLYLISLEREAAEDGRG